MFALGLKGPNIPEGKVLKAVGLRPGLLEMKTRDAETIPYGAGYVLLRCTWNNSSCLGTEDVLKSGLIQMAYASFGEFHFPKCS